MKQTTFSGAICTKIREMAFIAKFHEVSCRHLWSKGLPHPLMSVMNQWTVPLEWNTELEYWNGLNCYKMHSRS